MKIVRARRRPDGTLYYKICVNPKAKEENRIYEEFEWGPDVDPKVALREMKLLLEAKYGSLKEETLPVEGKDLDAVLKALER